MNNSIEILKENLEEAAHNITDNFCYGCYRVADGDNCPTCGSDDFMRHLEGVGVEYGIEWVVDSLIETRLEPVDGEELFEELLDECYPEVKVGCCTWSAGYLMKEMDPVAFRCGVSEELYSQAEDGCLYEHKGDFYQITDIEELIEDLEQEAQLKEHKAKS